MILDYDGAEQLIAIEILDASTRVDGVDTCNFRWFPNPAARQPTAAE